MSKDGDPRASKGEMEMISVRSKHFLRVFRILHVKLMVAFIILSILLQIRLLFADTGRIPGEYGEVIFKRNEESSKQLHIIGMSHRDSFTRMNGNNTPRVQAEVYKIGEWFVRQKGLALLLPEGFFTSTGAKTGSEKPSPGSNGECNKAADVKALERILSDNHKFINAEMLLKQHHSVRFQQVENLASYNAANKALRNLVNVGRNSSDYTLLKSEVEYLQERRLAAMLQRIPDVVDTEFRQGTVREKEAIFTIGMNHIHKIIQYFKENRIKITSAFLASNKYEDYDTGLNLIKENYGVCISIPRTLLSDQKVLEINKLDKIIPTLKMNVSDMASESGAVGSFRSR